MLTQWDQSFIVLGPTMVFIFFTLLFILLAFMQRYKPSRFSIEPLKVRIQKHFGLKLMALVTIQIGCGSVVPLKIASDIYAHHFGLIQTLRDKGLSYGICFLAAILFLDAACYLQHRAWHKVSLGWQIHKVHHTDNQIDITTGLRFHPLESLVFFIFKIVAIVIIGPPVLAFLVFELLFNGALLFSHANIFISPKVERILRYVIITPTLHALHHSYLTQEHGRNFGFIFSIWDRLFDSYLDSSRFLNEQHRLGLKAYSAPHYQTFKMMLMLPFKRQRKPALRSKLYMQET